MKQTNRSTAMAIAVILIAAALAACASPQTGASPQVYGTLGSPDATTTISGKQLPAPDPKFGGVIKNDALQSKPWWAPRIAPPKSAPNVLLIITDDAGFGVPSTFGGVIRRRPWTASPTRACATTAYFPPRCARRRVRP
jgi:hypothetical protein